MKAEVSVLGPYGLGVRRLPTSNWNCVIREHVTWWFQRKLTMHSRYCIRCFCHKNDVGWKQYDGTHMEISFKAFDGSLVFDGGRNGVPDSSNKGAN